MNCQNYQIQIEELTREQNPGGELAEHLQTCFKCGQFRNRQSELQRVLQNLPAVNAPNNFNFHVKSRLQREREKESKTMSAQWRNAALLTSTTFACVLALTIVFVRNDLLNLQSTTNQVVMMPVSTTDSQLIQNNPAISKELQQPDILTNDKGNTRQIIKDKNEKPESIARHKTTKTTKKLIKTEPARETTARIIASSNSKSFSFTPAPAPFVAQKFSNSLRPPDKPAAQESLKDFGIETKSETAGLRITSIRPNSQGMQRGLQVNDLIQKINNQKSTLISERNYKELNLTVFRSGQIKQITLVIQP